MIYIGTETGGDGTITIKVDGFLNRKTIDALADICGPHLADNASIILDLEGLTHTDELGRKYLKQVSRHVVFKNTPKFLRMDWGPDGLPGENQKVIIDKKY